MAESRPGHCNRARVPRHEHTRPSMTTPDSYHHPTPTVENILSVYCHSYRVYLSRSSPPHPHSSARPPHRLTPTLQAPLSALFPP